MAKTKRVPRAAARKFGRQPVTPGSSLTRRELERQKRAAVKARYGQQDLALRQEVASERQAGRDMTGWYSDYLAELAKHRTNVDQAAQQQNTALGNLATSVRTNDAQANQRQQEQRQADATQRGATADTGVAADAGNAANVRHQMLAAFAGQMAGQGRTSTNYADTLAHVVGPGQKLQAQAQNQRSVKAARQKLTALKDVKGAFGQQFADQVIASEAKSVLARQALDLDTQKFAADAAGDADSRAIQRERIRAGSQTARARVRAQRRKDRQAQAKEHAEHVSEVRGKSSDAIGRLDDIQGRWDMYRKTPVKDAEGNTRRPTDDEIRARLVSEKFTAPEITLALAWRRAATGGGFLTKSEQAIAHRLGIRVPRKLIESKWVGQNRPN